MRLHPYTINNKNTGNNNKQTSKTTTITLISSQRSTAMTRNNFSANQHLNAHLLDVNMTFGRTAGTGTISYTASAYIAAGLQLISRNYIA